MAVKKSELYASLWQSCDELRGSMDSSQYKDYVLVLLFMKYVSDKGGALVDIPEGGSFADMSKLKGQADIGDQLNKIIGRLAEANDLKGIITVADFNDDEKLGKGKEKVDRLTNLIAIFEKEELDFSGQRAADDDLLGDAYEYLMRHFATESGKSKGQFYTPAEVSQILARVIGIEHAGSASDTLYDPTCGSGSLLLKAADEAPNGEISIYGQERDNATRALAVMNMWLHGNPTSEIEQGNTLAQPRFLDRQSGKLKQFDFAVANPPFSDKAWTNGVDVDNDPHERFEYGTPPAKNGDYAFLLHILASLKSTGKAAIILPLGVLFRGNAEAVIRKQLVRRGYLKGIIGLPPNLFYGTGIAACVLVIDKETAAAREHVFMIDASREFLKDGNKNRLRERDVHRIVDIFNRQQPIPGYSRRVPLAEIADEKNAYNLNLPRYVDAQTADDRQDIEAHLRGGIPARDVAALDDYWTVFPGLRAALFAPTDRPDYRALRPAPAEVKAVIFAHPEFKAYAAEMDAVFAEWRKTTTAMLKALDTDLQPRALRRRLGESLLKAYHGRALVNKYAVYQHLADYWRETLQDDAYELAADGWEAGRGLVRLLKKPTKKGGTGKAIAGLEGLAGRLIPTRLVVTHYFAKEQAALDQLETDLENAGTALAELVEEHGDEDGLLADALTEKGKLTKGSLGKRIKELGKKNKDNADEYALLQSAKKLMAKQTKLTAAIKKAKKELEYAVNVKYPKLTTAEIKTLLVEGKWLDTLQNRVAGELDAISHRLTGRVRELAERYATPLPELESEVAELKTRVSSHLARLGFTV